MHFQDTKLCASGQDLGGDLLFGLRLGFSGTPSDLLPVEMRPCRYEEGDDANVMHVLMSPRVVSFKILNQQWSVDNLLHDIANTMPQYHALIDTGALVTGYSNKEVACKLLAIGARSLLCSGLLSGLLSFIAYSFLHVRFCLSSRGLKRADKSWQGFR